MFNLQFFRGHFEWNSQTNELELFSDNQTGGDGSRRKSKSAHAPLPVFQFPHFIKERLLSGKTTHGILSTSGNPGVTPRMAGKAARVSPRLGLPRGDKSVVTLNDVKMVALADVNRERLETGALVSRSFRKLLYKDQFNNFLITLVRYFKCFFESLEQQKRPHKTSYLEPSKAEIKAIEETKKKMVVAKRHLGQAYCVLLLGTGMEKQHHMGCGKQRVSSTHKDMKMYEDLYLFCTSLVHVTFRRKEVEKIRFEVGDMLRSPMYNPASRHTRYSTPEKSSRSHKPYVKDNMKPIGKRVEELLAVKLPPIHKLTPAEHRRQFGKRPAIMKAIHQRSTALISLLPLPQESSNYLFEPSFELRQQFVKSQEHAEPAPDLMKLDFFGLEKIGIIGEPLDLFNPDNLMPKNCESEDELASGSPSSPAGNSASSLSGQNEQSKNRALSRATTEDSIQA